jgi:hypothetical protein
MTRSVPGALFAIVLAIAATPVKAPTTIVFCAPG